MEISQDVMQFAVNNIEIICDAYNVVEELDQDFSKHIAGYLQEYIAGGPINNETWTGSDKWFSPLSWSNGDEDYKAWYELAWCGEEHFWLFHAAGIGARGLGLALVPVQEKSSEYEQKIRKLFKDHEQELSGACLMPCFGKKKRQYLFFPFRSVSLEALAKAGPDWEDALKEEMDEALEHIKAAHAVIDGFVRNL